MKKNINLYLFLLLNAFIYLFGISSFTSLTNKSTLISIILSGVMGYILLAIFLNIKNNKILSIKNINLFFKIIIFILLSILLLFILKKQVMFINYNVLNTVNIYLIISSIVLLGIYIVYKDIKTIIKSSIIFFYIFIFLFFITFIFCFNKIDINNLLYILDSNLSNISLNNLYFLIIFLSPYSFLYLMDYKLDNKEIIKLKKGYLFNVIFLFIWFLIIIGILGINLTNLYSYPEVFILKKISFLNIIERMESIFSINIFLCEFLLFSSVLYGLVSLFKFKNKKLFLLIISIILILSYSYINVPNIIIYIVLFLLFIIFSIC